MSEQKLTREHVLRTSEEISALLKNRPKSTLHLSFYEQNRNHIEVQAITLDDSSHEKSNNRLGLAIPKKLAKRAIDRNRIKRLIREAFRQKQTSAPMDMVVKLKSPIGKKTRHRLREQERQVIRVEIDSLFYG